MPTSGCAYAPLFSSRWGAIALIIEHLSPAYEVVREAEILLV